MTNPIDLDEHRTRIPTNDFGPGARPMPPPPRDEPLRRKPFLQSIFGGISTATAAMPMPTDDMNERRERLSHSLDEIRTMETDLVEAHRMVTEYRRVCTDAKQYITMLETQLREAQADRDLYMRRAVELAAHQKMIWKLAQEGARIASAAETMLPKETQA